MSQANLGLRNQNNRTLSSLATQSQAPSSTLALGTSSIASQPDLHSDIPQAPEKLAAHQRFVLADPVAFKYLEEDPSVQVLVRREKLKGYECYLVEQWACSRTHPTFIITTYTGDPSNVVTVGVLSVPTNEEIWSDSLKIYFKALDRYHARRRDTPLGILMITNLSAFPSSLTVIAIPAGNVKNYRVEFFVNENLKRLGCSGRVGLTLSKPSGATAAKFYQLYRASDKNPLEAAVIELVKLCQVALVLFDKLPVEYADGLLCDMTEKAINDWWVEFGTEYFNTEPHDGILGPTTVAALLGLLTGARNRLHAYGAPVSKDVFDIEHTKRAIAYFQKSQRITKTRRLDRHTLGRLHRATAKAASGEGWIVPRAVKSTVAELSGKGGEMVMDMVGGREKAGIAEVETVDIELFVQLIHGARSKWLWQGKPRKTQSGDMFSRLSGDDNVVFQSNDQGGFEWSARRKDALGDSPRELARTITGDSQRARDVEDRNRLSKKQPDRNQPHKTHESGRGFGRIKDAVRGHGSRHPKDEAERLGIDSWRDGDELSTPHPTNITSAPRVFDDHSFTLLGDKSSQASRNPVFAHTITETPIETPGPTLPRVEPVLQEEKLPTLGPPIKLEQEFISRSASASIAGSTYRGIDLDDLLPTSEMPDRNVGLLLRRSRSFSRCQKGLADSRNAAFWPRHLSFSVAEDSVLTWEGINEPMDGDQLRDPDLAAQWAIQKMTSEDAKSIRRRLLDIEAVVGNWVTREISNLQDIDDLIDQDQEELNGLYFPRLEEYQALREESMGMLEFEKSQLSEGIKEIEVLSAKLEYEINALHSKVEDVKDGVIEFERQVNTVEDRVAELEYDMRTKEGWFHWLIRLSTGLGKVPATSDTTLTR